MKYRKLSYGNAQNGVDNMVLMTKEQYKNTITRNISSLKSEPLYQCEKCGGDVRQDSSICYTSYPPKYRYVCDDCGYEEVW